MQGSANGAPATPGWPLVMNLTAAVVPSQVPSGLQVGCCRWAWKAMAASSVSVPVSGTPTTWIDCSTLWKSFRVWASSTT